MTHPRVSIITPTYNQERFIGQCIESVLAQTYLHWEQIIIDDGSTDKTGEIIAQYKDERIKYIRQDNVGIWRLGETYNKALKISQGELIAVLEGDDFWPAWKLERQIAVFEREKVVLSFGKAAVTNSQGKTVYISSENLKWFRGRKKEEILRKLLLQNFIPACTAMCRKDALLSIGGFQQPEDVPYVDYPTWLELCLVGEIQPVDEICGYWRRHRRQMSAVLTPEMTRAHNKCCLDFFEHLPQELKQLMRLSTDELFNVCQYNVASSYFASGRTNLFQDKWVEARQNFTQALTQGNLPTKIKSLLGIACSYLHLDLEWAALLMRRPRLNKLP